jgi:pyridinium-3,5-bisthiocarboxylic acid mononucleotide nickel chelatase
LTSPNPLDKTHQKPKTTVKICDGSYRVNRMKIAYLDCFAGASGDMILGAFLDAGLEMEALTKALKTLPLDGYVLQALREARSHLFGTRFVVDADKNKQPPRTFSDIKNIITNSALSGRVKERSIRVFESLAAEEGKIHACAPEKVHFHEVGAVDSIVDIVGAVFALEYLEIESLYASPLPLGSGFVETRHGAIPLPAPATIALLKGIPVYDSGIKEELVTPTGAALLKGLARAFGPMPPMVVESIGYGVGARSLSDRPNLLRVLLGREEQEIRTDTVVVLEANVDDANPEWLGYLMERLFREGALDVLFCPVHMKKNRPGVLIQVIGKPHHTLGVDDANPEWLGYLMERLFREGALDVLFCPVHMKKNRPGVLIQVRNLTTRNSSRRYSLMRARPWACASGTAKEVFWTDPLQNWKALGEQ